MAWLVTEPDELATGFAVALTPPTSAAKALRGEKLRQIPLAITD